jgi:hypothetical protein
MKFRSWHTLHLTDTESQGPAKYGHQQVDIALTQGSATTVQVPTALARRAVEISYTPALTGGGQRQMAMTLSA